MAKRITALFFFLAAAVCSPVVAQNIDSVRVDTLQSDTLESVIIHPCDTCPSSTPDTSQIVDTLSEEYKAQLAFEERRKALQDSLYVAEPPVSYFDSLKAYFVSSRLNYRDRIDRSFYHDAGDYFRSSPDFFTLDYQVTPMRKTVQPYGLIGDRFNILVGPYQVHPFEHTVQPDGMIDFNDLPTALDDDVYILPGPVGAIFGGSQMVATLMTGPSKPDSNVPQSAFLVDKGSFAYSYARGRYSKSFMSGRQIDMSIGYRNSDGPIYGRGDDAYHYYTNAVFPIGRRWAVNGNGWLYNRNGRLYVTPEAGGKSVDRERIDRAAHLTLVRSNEVHTATDRLTYTHIRQASRLAAPYNGNFNNTGHNLALSREWVTGETAFKAELAADYLEYDDSYSKYDRHWGEASLSMARLSSGWRYAVTLRNRYVEGFKSLPTADVLLYRDSEKLFVMLSAGYTERAPSLHELHLRRRQIGLYGQGIGDYVDEGNPNLKSERQLVGNARVELGSPENCWSASVTGGHIKDGIDWQNKAVDNGITQYTLFSPINENIDFVSTSLTRKLKINDFVRFTGGGSYHYIDYKSTPNPAYLPEYQAFSGLELHVYWKQRLLHLFAYGEVVYNGPYRGYFEEGLGKTAVVNVKLSFRMRSFRFHYVIQNALSNQYDGRDYFQFPGRYVYYGFTWDFLD